MPDCTVIIETKQEPISNATLKQLLQKTLKAIAANCDEMADLSIKLTTDSEITKLNHQFRGMNKPTNVLSFTSNEKGYLGDIAISLETVADEASAQGKTFDAHLAHMVVHGILHLLDYDHEDELEANEMETLEKIILSKLSITDPYQITKFQDELH